ncbi:MAG: hypothetical protein AB1724_01900 [Thermodesulfobacteriota bacterium]
MTKSIPKTSQLYFFLMPDETKIILKFLVDQNCIIIGDRSESIEPNEIKIFNEISKVYICPSELKDKIQMTKVSNEIYVVDETTSPVIEFSCSILRKSELSRGRIYFRGGYFGRDQWMPYPDVLFDIYKKVTSLMNRKFLTKNREYKAYISKGSQNYISEGGVMSQF